MNFFLVLNFFRVEGVCLFRFVNFVDLIYINNVMNCIIIIVIIIKVLGNGGGIDF